MAPPCQLLTEELGVVRHADRGGLSPAGWVPCQAGPARWAIRACNLPVNITDRTRDALPLPRIACDPDPSETAEHLMK